MKLNDTIIIKIFLALYVLSYIVLAPSYFTFGDEAQYAHGAFLLGHGESLKVTDPYQSMSFNQFNDYFAPQYPFGTMLFLALFTYFGTYGLLFSGLIFHLIGWYFFMRTLVKLGHKKIFSLLYLFYPALTFFSGTIMSENLSAMLITMAMYFYVRDNDYLSGMIFGLATLVRYPNILVFGVFILVSSFRSRKKVMGLLFGMVPFIVFILIYNNWIYGTILSTGYKTGLALSLSSKFSALGQYLLILFLLYPFMIIAPLLYHGDHKKELILCTLPFIVIYSWLNPNIFHYDFIKNSVISVRYLVPIIPFFLIAYVGLLERIFIKKMTIIILLTGMFIASGAVMYAHHDFNEQYASAHNIILKNTEPGSLIIADRLGMIFVNRFDNRYGMSIEVSNLDLYLSQAKARFENIYLIDLFNQDRYDAQPGEPVSDVGRALDGQLKELFTLYHSTTTHGNAVTIYKYTPQ